MMHLTTRPPPPTMSILSYMMITLDEMIEQSLDDLENTNNTIVQQMNRRVDEIQESVKESMQRPHLMEFMSMSVILPLIGITLFMFGSPLIVPGVLAMAGPLYLMNFLEDQGNSRIK